VYENGQMVFIFKHYDIKIKNAVIFKLLNNKHIVILVQKMINSLKTDKQSDNNGLNFKNKHHENRS
jgi:hypothetical protein